MTNRFANFRQSGSLNHVDALDNDALRRLAPSIFAPAPHESRSQRYAYIPTLEVIDGLRANGFVPTFAKQGLSRIEGKEDFTKHMIRFRRAGEASVARELGGLYAQAVVVNSHDGTSTYQVYAGLLRLVCLNGMLTADRDLAMKKVSHVGDVTGKVIEASYEVIDESRRAIETAGAWAGVTLDREEQQVMAMAARVIRFGDTDGNVNTPIPAEQMLRIRRRDDAATDLWTVTSRIQENAIRGGLTAMSEDAEGRPRRVSSREVKSIDGDVRLNRALWMLGERMAELKGAA